VRIPVARFTPNRNQRRTLRRADNLKTVWEPARFTPQLYQLYARYINLRHPDGDMFPPSEEQFASFLMGDSEWSHTRFMVIYDEDQPASVAVTDKMQDGLSAIYTFFDPDYDRYSLGTLSILQQIEACKRSDQPYLYLGYWIQKCEKMNYKTAFQPLEYFELDRWKTFPQDTDNA
jgi:arginine-tRNA-protein transferase